MLKDDAPSLLDTLATAARMLAREAGQLRMCHTIRGRWGADDWQAKADYDAMMETSRRLMKAHKYMQSNPLGGPAKVFDACADAIRAGDDIDKVMTEFGLSWRHNV